MWHIDRGEFSNQGIWNRKHNDIGFFQRLVGYSLLGKPDEDVLAIPYGSGSNGKSTVLGAIRDALGEDDILIVQADHGNDPTWHGTDHTRERVPLLLYSPALKESVDLGLRQTYADLGMSIMDNFGLTGLEFGTSFLSELR